MLIPATTAVRGLRSEVRRNKVPSETQKSEAANCWGEKPVRERALPPDAVEARHAEAEHGRQPGRPTTESHRPGEVGRGEGEQETRTDHHHLERARPWKEAPAWQPVPSGRRGRTRRRGENDLRSGPPSLRPSSEEAAPRRRGTPSRNPPRWSRTRPGAPDRGWSARRCTAPRRPGVDVVPPA